MSPYVLGVIGPSGTGKTTMLERVIPALRARGLRVAAIKHSHHHVEFDKPGKDSYRLRHAGAEAMILSNPLGWSLMVDGEHDFDTLLAVLSAMRRFDLILVEGLRSVKLPRLEVHRAAIGQPPRYPDDDNIIAVAAKDLRQDAPIPVFDLDDTDAIADFILQCVVEYRVDNR